MAGIKFGAHPMVVAVAMGLLGPGAVLDEGDDEQGLFGTSQLQDEEEIEAPTPDEFARVEDLWHSVRTTV